MFLVHRLRLRVLALLVAMGLAAIAVVSLASWPVWPVVGVAVTAAALVVNRLTSRLDDATCWGCGASIAGRAAGEYGVTCPSCGAINQRLLVAQRRADDPPSA